MARPAYAVTNDDLIHVRAYVGNQLRSFNLELVDPEAVEIAYNEYLRMSRLPPSTEAADQMQAWCAKYLTDAEWDHLKASVRKRRQRWLGSRKLKTVTISANAHRLLSELAKRDKVTLSEALELHLAKMLNRPQTTYKSLGARR
jgi:macrodomain Ter protein organizer (MatP/YcbG family)